MPVPKRVVEVGADGPKRFCTNRTEDRDRHRRERERRDAERAWRKELEALRRELAKGKQYL